MFEPYLDDDILKYKGFAFDKDDIDSKESKVLILFANWHKIKCLFISEGEIPPDYIPIGSVDFVFRKLKNKIPPDYFPDFVKKYLNRKIWISPSVQEKTFVKPLLTTKRFNGFIAENFEDEEPLLCQEIVSFKNEWRYYVAKGKIISVFWYKGQDEDLPAPKLNLDIPRDWCGTIDMGILDSGQLEIVECHHPFSCGWYGTFTEAAKYAYFVREGWSYINHENFTSY